MSTLQTLMLSAAQTHRTAAEAARLLRNFLQARLAAKVPAGTMLDLRQRGNPQYLANLRPIGGNARGTHVFRIEKVASVDENATYPALSLWECDATPMSEITGKPMSATAGGRRGATRLTVRLRGYVTSVHTGEDPAIDAELAQFLKDFDLD
jgi:hypothetical protein